MNNSFIEEGKNIVFIGFMGVGKTTIAKLVAKKLNLPFIDIDQAIEKEYNMPTTDIFTKYGEATFRQKEKEYILHYCAQDAHVISLGGGAFLQEEIRKVCLADTFVIHLNMSWEAWKKRLRYLVDSRPVLQNKSMEEIGTLFNERQHTYAQHHLQIVTDNKRPNKIANEIIAVLQKRNDRP